MDQVWIRSHDGVLIRAASIIALENTPDGLRAECRNGRRVNLTDSPCSIALQLALLDEIRHGSGRNTLSL